MLHSNGRARQARLQALRQVKAAWLHETCHACDADAPGSLECFHFSPAALGARGFRRHGRRRCGGDSGALVCRAWWGSPRTAIACSATATGQEGECGTQNSRWLFLFSQLSHVPALLAHVLLGHTHTLRPLENDPCAAETKQRTRCAPQDRLGDLRQRLASARTHPDSDSEGLRHAASPHRAAAPLAPAPVSPSCSSPSGPASSPPTTDRSRGPSPDLDPGHAPGRAENGEEGRGQGGASLAPNPRHPSSSRTAENDREVTGSPDDGNGREPRPSSGNAATPEKDSEAGSGLRLEASLPASASGTGDDDGHDGAGVGLVRSSQSQEDPPGGGRRVGRLRRWLSRIASSSAS